MSNGRGHRQGSRHRRALAKSRATDLELCADWSMCAFCSERASHTVTHACTEVEDDRLFTGLWAANVCDEHLMATMSEAKAMGAHSSFISEWMSEGQWRAKSDELFREAGGGE